MMSIVTSCFYMSIVTYCFYMYHIFTFLIFLLVYCDARTAPSVPIKAYIIIIIIIITYKQIFLLSSDKLT